MGEYAFVNAWCDGPSFIDLGEPLAEVADDEGADSEATKSDDAADSATDAPDSANAPDDAPSSSPKVTPPGPAAS